MQVVASMTSQGMPLASLALVGSLGLRAANRIGELARGRLVIETRVVIALTHARVPALSAALLEHVVRAAAADEREQCAAKDEHKQIEIKSNHCFFVVAWKYKLILPAKKKFQAKKKKN